MIESRQSERYLAVLYTGMIIDTMGLLFICCFLFAEDETVVEEEIEDHNNNRIEGESASSENEFVGKRQMDSVSNIESEFVQRGEQAKKLGECGCDGDGEDGIPDEESNNGMFGDGALFPCDFGVCEICNNGGDCGSDEIRKPYEIIIFDDKVGENCEEGIVKTSDAYSYDEIAKGVPRGFDVFGGLCMGGFF